MLKTVYSLVKSIFTIFWIVTIRTIKQFSPVLIVMGKQWYIFCSKWYFFNFAFIFCWF